MTGTVVKANVEQVFQGALEEAVLSELLRVCELSEFVYQNVTRYPEMARELFTLPLDTREDSWYRLALEPLLEEAPDDFDRLLREFRRREMVRIIFRDFSKRSDLIETTRDLSLFAAASIDVALRYHYQSSSLRFGLPTSAEGQVQQMCVLALGKLGAFELNLSSDVDLVMLYDRSGSTDGEKKVSNQEFFLRVARRLIKSLDERTADGFVFRVDMRLRPYGESSPVVSHWDAMETYFLEQGRDWERYAYIKARPVAGDMLLGERFLDWLKPFVYRRHLDYGAIDALREMKLLINRQVVTREQQNDLKLGSGGIREIEFIAQAHQLIWGGTNERLQERRLLVVLKIMAEERLFPVEEIAELEAAYVFLRNSEHAIQGEKDRQTHLLPTDGNSASHLAQVMAFDDVDDYLQALQVHRNNVRRCFDSFMSASEIEQEVLLEGNMFWPGVWRDPMAKPELLSGAGFVDFDTVCQTLVTFADEMLHQDLQEIVTERINKLMPLLLSLVSTQESPDETLFRVLPIIGAIERRSTYISYLLENVDALKRTIELCAMSPWVATKLNDFPILLYELADRNIDAYSFTSSDLIQQLEEMLLLIESEDLESQMDTLRVFKNAAVLRVAVSELVGHLPLMKASDALTNIAEVILEKSLGLAWSYLVRRHGKPADRNGVEQDRQFAIIAYGKLGGIELAYGSDLDLVFLFDADIHGSTTGNREINNNVFFVRLAQRIIHILTSFTRFGALYEADLRLRPAGNKGAMVSTIAGFQRYQSEEAWTWEHQALIRARFVAGDATLGVQFDAVRKAILQSHRNQLDLKKDVVEMREKMRTHLIGAREQPQLLSSVDLKHEMGAIVDIEFMVQYAVLAWAEKHQVLTQWTDMMRLLDEIRDFELMQDDAVQLLQQAYVAYRSAVHYQWLGGEVSSFDTLEQYRQDVFGLWREVMSQGES
jgi:glutamate-ammonia-ligase adenylyltransferase